MFIPLEGFKIGRVKWFNVAKGWGFLTPVNPETRALEKEKEVFVHQVRYSCNPL